MSQVSVNAAPHRLPSGADGFIVQISASPPKNGAVAVVLDTSDSFPLNRAILSHASKLISVLPRRWPLWLYRISSGEPVAPLDSYRVEDLQEERLDFQDCLERTEVISQGSKCGSFVRPALEAIEKANGLAEVDEVIVLLLTDGEFFDVAPCEVLKTITLAGLSTNLETAKVKQWHRVFPGTPLHTLTDQKLDQLFATKTSPYWGLCEIKWELENDSLIQPHLFDVTAKAFRKLTDSRLESNLSLDAPLLHFELSRDEFARCRWTCRSLQSLVATPLQLSFVEEEIFREIIDSLASHDKERSPALSQIYSASNEDSKGFNQIWEDARKAAMLAEKGERWLDEQDKLVLFQDLSIHNEQGKSKHHAFLCLIGGDLPSVATKESQIKLIALDRASKPAFSWTPDLPVEGIQVLNKTELFFDAERARWYVQFDDRKAEELDPYGSQLIKGIELADSNWTIIFSGSLI